jgi:hypothetical protein
MTATRNYICQDCQNVWEYLHHPNMTDDPSPGCTACGSTNFAHRVGLKSDPVTIVKGNHDFADRQRDRLTERSNEHYKRKGGREASVDAQNRQWKREGVIQ